ncbi:MAG TPA: hypothetical protein VMW06_00065 [Desulfobacterales bacterium]|nr:hypothetical protein [Desulfobacterales bacterium]
MAFLQNKKAVGNFSLPTTLNDFSNIRDVRAGSCQNLPTPKQQFCIHMGLHIVFFFFVKMIPDTTD